MATRSLLLLICFFIWIVEGAVYQFSGNPYTAGPLPSKHFEISEIFDSSPAHVTVYFPTVPGSYAPLVFIPGLFGIIYEQFYSDVLEKIASHGYILVGVDLDYPAATNKRNKIRAEDDKLFRLINWLIANLNDKELALHSLPDVKADWSVLGLMGHSAGCVDIQNVAESNETITKAIAFIEPMSYSFTKPLPYSLPALCYGTEYSEEDPKCIDADYDYRHFYSMLKCPKVQMNAIGYGHCDILNDDDWELCRALHFCKTDSGNDRVLYRDFISGLISAFFGYYLQGSTAMLSYVVNETNIPVVVGNFESDTNC